MQCITLLLLTVVYYYYHVKQLKLSIYLHFLFSGFSKIGSKVLAYVQSAILTIKVSERWDHTNATAFSSFTAILKCCSTIELLHVYTTLIQLLAITTCLV